MNEPALVHEILDSERSGELAPGERNELPASLALWRRFVGVVDGEVQEVIAMVHGRPWVGYARSEAEQVALLRRAQKTRNYSGAYLLFNAIDARIAERYGVGEWGPAHAGRASDKEILVRRAVFIDVDPVRPKGISATDGERSAAREVAMAVRELLTSRLGKDSVGWGSSGNGYYMLIPIVHEIPNKDHGTRIKKLLTGLAAKFNTVAATIDGSVFNAARLMAAPGTLKAKGARSEARPHRITSFCCSMNAPERIPLEVIA